MNNETSGIHFDTLEKLCSVLECDSGDIIILKKGKRRKKRNEQIT
jgi:DNA-binding Xre family transcriptional regulator